MRAVRAEGGEEGGERVRGWQVREKLHVPSDKKEDDDCNHSSCDNCNNEQYQDHWEGNGLCIQHNYSTCGNER